MRRTKKEQIKVRRTMMQSKLLMLRSKARLMRRSRWRSLIRRRWRIQTRDRSRKIT
jgi:hypothetical protein